MFAWAGNRGTFQGWFGNRVGTLALLAWVMLRGVLIVLVAIFLISLRLLARGAIAAPLVFLILFFGLQVIRTGVILHVLIHYRLAI